MQSFREFYEMVSNTKEATELPPTPLGGAGSERILNNSFLHHNPWHVGCVELREGSRSNEGVFTYDNIAFASLRRKKQHPTVHLHPSAYRCAKVSLVVSDVV